MSNKFRLQHCNPTKTRLCYGAHVQISTSCDQTRVEHVVKVQNAAHPLKRPHSTYHIVYGYMTSQATNTLNMSCYW